MTTKITVERSPVSPIAHDTAEFLAFGWGRRAARRKQRKCKGGQTNSHPYRLEHDNSIAVVTAFIDP